jgi:hypothetical protein
VPLNTWLGFIVLIYLIVALILRSRRPWVPVWCIMAFASFMVILFGLLNSGKQHREPSVLLHWSYHAKRRQQKCC